MSRAAVLAIWCASFGCAGERAARLGDELAAQGRYGEAIVAYQEAQRLAPGREKYAQRLSEVMQQAAAAEIARGDQRREEGELDTAIAAYRRATTYGASTQATLRIQRTEQERSELALQRQNIQKLNALRQPLEALRKCRPLLQAHRERTEPELVILCERATNQVVDAAVARAKAAERSRDLATAYKIMKEAQALLPTDPRVSALVQQYGQKVAASELLARGSLALRDGDYADAYSLLSEAAKLLPGHREAVSKLDSARAARLKELLAKSKEANRRGKLANGLLLLEAAQPLTPPGSRQATELGSQIDAQRLALAQALLQHIEHLPTHSEGAAWAYQRMAQLLAPAQYAAQSLPNLRSFMTVHLQIESRNCSQPSAQTSASCSPQESGGWFNAALEQALASELTQRSSLLNGLVELGSAAKSSVTLIAEVLQPPTVHADRQLKNKAVTYVERQDRKPNPKWVQQEERLRPLEKQLDTLTGRYQAEAQQHKILDQQSEQRRGERDQLKVLSDAYVAEWNQSYERKLLQNGSAQELRQSELRVIAEELESKEAAQAASENAEQRSKLNEELAALRLQLKQKQSSLAELKLKRAALQQEQEAGPPTWPRSDELRAAQNAFDRAQADASEVSKAVQSLEAQRASCTKGIESIKAIQAKIDPEIAEPVNSTYLQQVTHHTHRAASVVRFYIRDELLSSILSPSDRVPLQALGVQNKSWADGTYTGITSERLQVVATDTSSEQVVVPGEPPLVLSEDKLELPSDEELQRELAGKLAKSYLPKFLPLLQHPSDVFWMMARYLGQQPTTPKTQEHRLHFWVLTLHGADLLSNEREGRRAALAAIRAAGLDLENNRVDLTALSAHLN